jgi:hypothetical protein
MKAHASIITAVLVALPTAAQQQTPAATATLQKQKISFRVPASNTKYTQQQVLDVGDVAGHQIRIFEIHRTFQAPTSVASGGQSIAPVSAGASAKAVAPAPSASDVPMFNGVRATEQWVQGVSDYVNTNGRVYGYATYIMENGDKIFSHYEGINQATGTGKANGSFVHSFIGGTGKFRDLRGMMRANNVATFAEGRATSNDTQYEGEYWMQQ